MIIEAGLNNTWNMGYAFLCVALWLSEACGGVCMSPSAVQRLALFGVSFPSACMCNFRGRMRRDWQLRVHTWWVASGKKGGQKVATWLRHCSGTQGIPLWRPWKGRALAWVELGGLLKCVSRSRMSGRWPWSPSHLLDSSKLTLSFWLTDSLTDSNTTLKMK